VREIASEIGISRSAVGRRQSQVEHRDLACRQNCGRRRDDLVVDRNGWTATAERAVGLSDGPSGPRWMSARHRARSPAGPSRPSCRACRTGASRGSSSIVRKTTTKARRHSSAIRATLTAKTSSTSSCSSRPAPISSACATVARSSTRQRSNRAPLGSVIVSTVSGLQDRRSVRTFGQRLPASAFSRDSRATTSKRAIAGQSAFMRSVRSPPRPFLLCHREPAELCIHDAISGRSSPVLRVGHVLHPIDG
jgi:hypothetical protein